MMDDDPNAVVVTPDSFYKSVVEGKNGFIGDYSGLNAWDRIFKYALDSAYSSGFKEAIANAIVVFSVKGGDAQVCVTSSSNNTIDNAFNEISQHRFADMQQHMTPKDLDAMAELFMTMAEKKREKEKSQDRIENCVEILTKDY